MTTIYLANENVNSNIYTKIGDTLELLKRDIGSRKGFIMYEVELDDSETISSEFNDNDFEYNYRVVKKQTPIISKRIIIK